MCVALGTTCCVQMSLSEKDLIASALEVDRELSSGKYASPLAPVSQRGGRTRGRGRGSPGRSCPRAHAQSAAAEDGAPLAGLKAGMASSAETLS